MSNQPPQPPGGPQGNSNNGNSSHPSYTPGPLYNRRSSYASVVAGAGLPDPYLPSSFQSPSPFQAALGGSRLSLPQPSPSSSYPPPNHNTWDHTRNRSVDMAERSMPWHRPSGLSTSAPGDNANARSKGESTGFFIPSYLQGSRYADKLVEEARNRDKIVQDTRSSPYNSAPGSLSTSSSSANLQSRFTSHRGLNHEIVEHAPRPVYPADSSDNSPPPPLPTRFSETDRNPMLELHNDGLVVKLTNPPRRTGDEASSIRADHPIPRMAGVYYYEVKLQGTSRGATSQGYEHGLHLLHLDSSDAFYNSNQGSSNISNNRSMVGIGFSGASATLNRLPGWEPNSWAYHGDDGNIYAARDQGKAYGHKFGKGDTVGCGINFRTKTAFFTRNGVLCGSAFRDIKLDKLYPIIGMKNQNEVVEANFGHKPFIFDIDEYYNKEKAVVMDEVKKANTANLAPPLTEHELIHKLIQQYLSHDGYTETAKAFANEVAKENDALASNHDGPADEPRKVIEPQEDEDAILRQKIRSAILHGDIEAALRLCDAHYPAVLRKHDLIYFRLRCRKFIEMVRLSTSSTDHPSGPSPLSERRQGKKASRGSGHSYDHHGVFDHQMELDDSTTAPPANGNTGAPTTWDANTGAMDTGAMDTSEDAASLNMPSDAPAVSETDLIEYGTNLRTEWAADPRPEVQRELEGTLALMVYPNPRESSLRELLEDSGRAKLAEDLNSAILVSQGKASSSALEKLVQQTEVMLADLGDDGGPGAFLNLRSDFLRPE
ncbi:SPRY-domain-containing protein [Microthyrium microscopicum]|uniref:SPRY-domain-containing protein n=1 Tax=Microthyrium microscopicum TaxID=703497 RepID=A0A6A6UB02_9PEZI|nr:SPRY-domain-containing protein [Microthyrium microscopicum]